VSDEPTALERGRNSAEGFPVEKGVIKGNEIFKQGLDRGTAIPALVRRNMGGSLKKGREDAAQSD